MATDVGKVPICLQKGIGVLCRVNSPWGTRAFTCLGQSCEVVSLSHCEARNLWPLTETVKYVQQTWLLELPQSRIARFSLVQHTKMGKIYQNVHKIYQMDAKYTKWPHNIPNGHELDQHSPLQDPRISTQIGIFGLNIYHLATLPQSTVKKQSLCPAQSS
jgi:hypothetical protein